MIVVCIFYYYYYYYYSYNFNSGYLFLSDELSTRSWEGGFRIGWFLYYSIYDEMNAMDGWMDGFSF